MVKPVYNYNKQNEKEKGNDREKEYLSKKRSEPDSERQEVDMVKLKKKINHIMISICNEAKESKNDLNLLYESMRKNYLLNEFTTNCLKYINKIILNIKKNHLKKFQGIFELNKIFILIIKELLMNEFELLLLSLYLESVDISSCDNLITFRDSLIFLCFLIKKLTLSEEKLKPINSFLNRKYQSFDDKFDKWFESNSSVFNNKLYFSYMEINQRFKEYNQSHSIYCKNNYIDYNLVIDRILTMSVPYNDNRNDNLFENKNINEGNNNLGNVLNSLSNSYKNLNINQNYLLNNNNNNNLNNFLNNYIPTLPGELYLNQNNNNNNLNCLHNTNIFSTKNKVNNEPINMNNKNKGLINPIIQQNENKDNKNNIELKATNESIINNSENNTQKETNKKSLNNKMFLVTQEERSNNNNIIKKEKEKEKENKVGKNITPNYLLYSMDNYNNISINKGNNNQKKELNNNLINNNENNIYMNNILGLNISQQINDYNPLKYNINLGINDINSSSRISLLSLENPYFMDVNNLYNNVFQGQGEENLKQLMNQSNENFFRSCLSFNGIYSSNNFYPNINNNNFININENNNNINYINMNQIPLVNNQNNINNNIQNNENLVINNINSEKNNKEKENNIIKEKNE